MVLEEIGVNYDLVLVDRKSEEQKTSGYLKLNPTGRIPTLADGELVICESAAICLYLCEKHPESNLVPKIGDPERPSFFQWLFYLTTSIQSELMLYLYPGKHTLKSDNVNSISKAQEKRVTRMFALVDKELESKNFLVGNKLSICDFFLFMLSHWAGEFKQPPLSFEHLGRHLRSLAKRPVVRNVCDAEGTSLETYR